MATTIGSKHIAILSNVHDRVLVPSGLLKEERLLMYSTLRSLRSLMRGY